MKHLYTLLIALLLSLTTFAQAPEKMSYQAVIRDASDNLLTNTTIGMQISILEGSETGTAVYVETHTPLSNANGLVSLEIGDGTVISGDFGSIDWTTGSYFIKTESDPEGGINYTISGTSQLLSVPYALYATSSGESLPYTAGEGISISGNQIENTAPDQMVSISGSGATTVSGAYPNFNINSTDEVDDADADPVNEIQTLSVSGDQLEISDGNSVTLPTGTTYTAGTNISLAGNAISNTAPDQTVILTGTGATTITGSYPSFSINSTDNVNDADANPNNEIQDISLVGNELSISDGSTVDLSGISNGGWSISGNTGTDASTDFIGTTDDQPLVFKINNENAGKIDFLEDGNLTFGYKALNSNTTGSYNLAYGYESLFSNTSANFNIAFGFKAMHSNTTGAGNISMGGHSLNFNTIGNLNIAIGYMSLYNNTTGSDNLAIGSSSLKSNTTGTNNIAVGNISLNKNTTGLDNTAVGFASLYSNTTGFSNIAIGGSALGNNTSGASNTALGYFSLNANITGYNNTATGYYSLKENTTGVGNTATGIYSLRDNTTGYFNTATGSRALQGNTTGEHNTGIGYLSLNSNTIGNNNTAIGYDTQHSNTSGSRNVAIGHQSSYENISGDQNVAIGMEALFNNLESNTTAVGYRALFSNTTGPNNTSVGYLSLEINTIGEANTSTGYKALQFNTTGSFNSAFGSQALYSNTIGKENIAIGTQALANNTNGSKNVAVGSNALQNNEVGFNTAIGHNSLTTNTTGYNNTAIGGQTLLYSVSGNNNTAIGKSALFQNTTADNNTAIGAFTLLMNTAGSKNTAIGISALQSNKASNNTAIGASALEDNNTGFYNVATGINALFKTTTGFQNVAFGSDALNSNTTGSLNVAIGDYAGATGNYSNRIAIGASTQNTASNQVRIGNGSITSIGGYANWSNVSDKRFKKNIRENVVGLDFIIKLRPVTYNLDLEAINNAIPSADKNRSIPTNPEKSNIIQTGFIAQEVEASAQSLGYDFSGVDAPKNDNDYYGLRYAEFVVPLVKATQEQQILIENQQDFIEEQQSILRNQQNEIDELRLLVNQLLKD